jgi:hypothetical protein
MKDAGEVNLLVQLSELEKRLLNSATGCNAALVTSILTPDFQEFGTSGLVYVRADIVDALADEPPTTISAEDFDVRVISADAALLTYKSTKTVDGAASVRALRSSLWVRRDGEWRMLFHQGTRIA